MRGWVPFCVFGVCFLSLGVTFVFFVREWSVKPNPSVGESPPRRKEFRLRGATVYETVEEDGTTDEEGNTILISPISAIYVELYEFIQTVDWEFFYHRMLSENTYWIAATELDKMTFYWQERVESRVFYENVTCFYENVTETTAIAASVPFNTTTFNTTTFNITTFNATVDQVTMDNVTVCNPLELVPVWRNVTVFDKIQLRRITIIESDGKVVYDSSQGVYNTFANMTEGRINENHNTRLSVLMSYLVETGAAYEYKFSNTVKANSNYVSRRFTDDGGVDYVVRASKEVPACGNGVVSVDEQCDDGNVVPGDGCSEKCSVEAGFSCFTDTSGLSFCLLQRQNVDPLCVDMAVWMESAITDAFAFGTLVVSASDAGNAIHMELEVKSLVSTSEDAFVRVAGITLVNLNAPWGVHEYTIHADFNVTTPQLVSLYTGAWAIFICTESYKQGEFYGFVQPISCVHTELGRPGVSATGTSILLLSHDEKNLAVHTVVQENRLHGDLTSVQIHGPNPSNGTIFLTEEFQDNYIHIGYSVGPEYATWLKEGALVVNVTTEEYPGGEISGSFPALGLGV